MWSVSHLCALKNLSATLHPIVCAPLQKKWPASGWKTAEHSIIEWRALDKKVWEAGGTRTRSRLAPKHRDSQWWPVEHWRGDAQSPRLDYRDRARAGGQEGQTPRLICHPSLLCRPILWLFIISVCKCQKELQIIPGVRVRKTKGPSDVINNAESGSILGKLTTVTYWRIWCRDYHCLWFKEKLRQGTEVW